MMRDQVIEAVQELLYDLEQEGNLTDAEAIRRALKWLKQMTEEEVEKLVEDIRREVYGEVQHS